MRKLLPAIFVVLGLLAACATPLNPTIVQDGNLAIAALNALNADAGLLGAPQADTTAITLATRALQTGLTDLQKGNKTAADFAALVNDEITTLAPTLLKDFHANATITAGVALLQAFIPVILADATQTATSTSPAVPHVADDRARLQIWVMGQRK